MAAEPKTLSGSYRLSRFLGQGGIGRVFLAYEGDRPVALKFLENTDPSYKGFFQEEVRLLSLFSHPNLVKIYDYFDKEGDWEFLAEEKLKGQVPPRGAAFSMEYVEGEALDRLPRDTPVEIWIDTLAQICHGLHYLHARNVLHSDLKPSNILRSPDGQVKILDFSLSTIRQEKRRGSSQVGTFPYMPPEAFLGDFDFRSDLFSLGVLLYQLLTGRFPYKQPLSPKGMAEIKPPTPLGQLRPDLPDYLAGIVERLLQPSPLNRPSSALTILRILQEHSAAPIYRFDEDETASIFLKTPLIGRDRELEEFAKASRPSPEIRGPTFFLVSGPTGIGRSRLLEAFKWRHLLAGTTFLSYSPQDATDWLPKWIARLGSEEPPAETDRDFFSLLEKLQKLAMKKYSVVAFADLHAWPSETLKPIKILLRRLAEAHVPIAVILEYNSEWRDLKFGWEDQADFGAEIHRFPLEDLNLEQSVELIAQANLGSSLPRPLAEKIAKAAGGRPLLLLEALRQVLAGKGLERVEKLTLPKNLEEVSRQRIQRLSPAGRDLLALLIASSQEVSPEMLSEFESELPRESALLELDRAGFIARRTLEAPNHTLAHPSLKPSFLHALPAPVLHAAHRRWLQYYEEKRNQGNSDDTTLLGIFEHATGAGDTSVQARMGIEALAALGRRGDYPKAIEWSEILLKIKDPNLNFCHLHAYRAPYLNRLGRFEEGLQAYQKWYELREDDETKLQRVKYFFLTGFTLFSAGHKEEARERLENCIQTGDSQAHPGLRPYHARANNLLAEIWEKQGNLEKARSSLEKALALAEGDPVLLAETEQYLGRLDNSALRFERALGHFQQALKYSQKLDNPQAEAIAWQYLGLLAKDRGRLQEALSNMERALALAKRGGEIPQWARYLGNRGTVFLEKGEWDKALEDFRQSDEMLKIVGGEGEGDIARIQLATAYLFLGNRERFQDLLLSLEKDQKRLETLSLAGSFLTLKGEAAYRLGNFKESEFFYREGLAVLPIAWGYARLQARWGILRAMARRGEISIAEVQAFLRDLPEQGAPFLAWRCVLNFTSQPREDLKKEDLTACAAAILSLESPLARLDLFQWIALHLHRLGFTKLTHGVAKRCRQEWNRLRQSLPEEYQMDFEKNQSLKDFEEELRKEPAPVKTSAGEAASAKPGSDRPQIPEARFRQFCEINRQIAQKSDLKEILERVMGAAIELTGAERGYLLLKDPTIKGGPLPGFQVKTARNINQQNLQGEDLQFSFSVVREAMNRGAPLLTDNAQEDARFRQSKSVHQFQLQSILVLPLEIEGTIGGALYLDHRYQPDCFSPEDVTMIWGFASQAALAIHKARMLEELKAAKSQLEVKVQDQAHHIEVLSEELSQSRKNLKYEYGEIIGKSPAIMKIFQTLDHVTRTKIPVWIWGESGTGKELVARSLHFNSSRKDGPFVDENCSAIPENLLESELFGYKKGAFTHAERDHVGLLEQASGGTLFLDEVGDMSLGMQAKLLRVLQENEVRPLGSNKKVKIDIRLVTASNRDLHKLVREEKFREDLFYRINGMTIKLPPLRERKEDIPLLIHHFIQKISKDFDLKPSELAEDAFQLLMQYPWPGNIRELEALVRNMLLFAKGKLITKDFLSSHQLLLETPASAASLFPPEELPEEKTEQRKELIQSLVRHRMDKEKVAAELGISLKSVYSRMNRYEIPIKKKELKDYLEREGR